MARICKCGCGCENSLSWHREIRCACWRICDCVPFWQRLLIRLIRQK